MVIGIRKNHWGVKLSEFSKDSCRCPVARICATVLVENLRPRAQQRGDTGQQAIVHQGMKSVARVTRKMSMKRCS